MLVQHIEGRILFNDLDNKTIKGERIILSEIK